ncbi:nucleotidyl transferase AbiEii/AbiGii toxin family protein [Streptomyces xanthochromogenes]|uniref:nucleotidyl transferase AbiEii/AbiGii toxin family protein n=1 Tax=Streptomyces xanthochromogenes TaxID=67384 RepID=UPI00342C79EE
MRGFLFQRLTARVFGADPDGWLLQGGQALLVRYASAARLSKDIDLQYLSDSLAEAHQALLAAAATDLGDYLRFIPHQRNLAGTDTDGINQGFDVYIGPRKVDIVHVDLVTRLSVTDTPPIVQLHPRPDLPWPTDWPKIRLYPLVDHLADKICAMYEWRGRNFDEPSSRHRDLADILLMSQHETIDATAAQRALRAEAELRATRPSLELRLPAVFEMPHARWRAGYAKAARDVSGLRGCATWDAALPLAAAFLNPLLGPDFTGTWQPERGRWEPGPEKDPQ